jgi:hypothetical protein
MSQLPPCIFCEKPIKALEPVLRTAFLFPPGDEGALVGEACVHLTCFINTIAGECAHAALRAIRDGEVDIGLERDDKDSLDGVVGELVARTIHKFSRGG